MWLRYYVESPWIWQISMALLCTELQFLLQPDTSTDFVLHFRTEGSRRGVWPQRLSSVNVWWVSFEIEHDQMSVVVSDHSDSGTSSWARLRQCIIGGGILVIINELLYWLPCGLIWPLTLMALRVFGPEHCTHNMTRLVTDFFWRCINVCEKYIWIIMFIYCALMCQFKVYLCLWTTRLNCPH